MAKKKAVAEKKKAVAKRKPVAKKKPPARKTGPAAEPAKLRAEIDKLSKLVVEFQGERDKALKDLASAAVDLEAMRKERDEALKTLALVEETRDRRATDHERLAFLEQQNAWLKRHARGDRV